MKWGKVGKVSAAAVALVAIAVVIAVMMTSAYDYDQTYMANAVYFVPEDIRVAGYCNEETVSIWVNTSVALGAGAVKFYYDPNCMNGRAMLAIVQTGTLLMRRICSMAG